MASQPREDRVQPPDDLKRNPGIGASKGTTMAGAGPDLIEGENTSEGDTENDANWAGGVREGRDGPKDRN